MDKTLEIRCTFPEENLDIMEAIANRLVLARVGYSNSSVRVRDATAEESETLRRDRNT